MSEVQNWHLLYQQRQNIFEFNFVPKELSFLKEMLFHPFINNFPHSPLGVLVGNENSSLLKGGNCIAVREFKGTLF